MKRFSPAQVTGIRRIAQTVFDDGDAEAMFQCFQDIGFIPRKTKLTPQRVLAWWAPIFDPSLGSGPFTFTPEVAAFVIGRNFDNFGEWSDVVRSMGIGPESKDWTFLTRIQVGLYSVLGALGATSDWRAVHQELGKGDPPQTQLGHQHHTWKASDPTFGRN